MPGENHRQFYHYGVNHRYNPYGGRTRRFRQARGAGAYHHPRSFFPPQPPPFRPTLFNPYLHTAIQQSFHSMPFNSTHPYPQFSSHHGYNSHNSYPFNQIFQYGNSDPNMLCLHGPYPHEAQYWQGNNNPQYMQIHGSNGMDRNGYSGVDNYIPQVNYMMDNVNMNTAGSSYRAQWNASHRGYGGHASYALHSNVNPYSPSNNFYQTLQTVTATSTNPYFVTPGNMMFRNNNNTAYSNQSTPTYPVRESNPSHFNGWMRMQNNFVNGNNYESTEINVRSFNREFHSNANNI